MSHFEQHLKYAAPAKIIYLFYPEIYRIISGPARWAGACSLSLNRYAVCSYPGRVRKDGQCH